MTKKLSPREEKFKQRLQSTLTSEDVSHIVRAKRVFRMLPRDPRCKNCFVPFEGTGGWLAKALFNQERSALNPLICNTCEEGFKQFQLSVEVKMSMLFADIRGSTPLAESMDAKEFRDLIDRFYSATTHTLIHNDALIDKLVGDEVSAVFLPSMVGKKFVRKSIETAQEMLKALGHTRPEGPWAPVGIGINTGKAHIGTVGSLEGMADLTVLGDEINVASRLASHAKTGEIIISTSTAEGASWDTSQLETRTLSLKGKSEPVDVYVLKVQPN